MGLRLGDDAPNFTAETTEGTINLYDYLGYRCGVLFSHPKDYTPVCTTELGAVANLKSEFDPIFVICEAGSWFLRRKSCAPRVSRHRAAFFRSRFPRQHEFVSLPSRRIRDRTYPPE